MSAPLPESVRTLIDSGRTDEAVASLKRIVARPAGARDTAVLGTLGRLLQEQRHLEQALFFLGRAVQQDPTDPVMQGRYGSALYASERFEEAERACRACVAGLPGAAWAHANLGLALVMRGRPTEGIAELREALRIDPGHSESACSLAHTLAQIGLADDALGVLDALHAVSAPTLFSLLTRASAANYSARVSPQTVTAWHREFGTLQAQATAAAGVEPFVPTAAGPWRPGRPLRVGLLSPDFREHSVAYFALGLLEHRSRKDLHVSCWSLLRRDDAMSRRFKGAADAWHDASEWSDLELLRALRKDGPDVLIDLVGHGGPGRQGVLSARAAPVQITAIGYPATTGVPCVDFRLCDSITDPPGSERLLSERPMRLDGCFLCYTPPPSTPNGLPDVEPGPALRRAADGPVVFGSFNNLAKQTPEVLQRWGEILARVPGSRLLLKSKPLDDAAVRARVVETLGRFGVAADRIGVLPFAGSTREHLACYGEVDIALDPFPYNGTTTTCEALLMGVPVVTVRGDRHAARVGASLLSAVGLDELVAGDLNVYREIAVRLAGDRTRLRDLRQSLRSRLLGSPLCDAKAYAGRFWNTVMGVAGAGVAAPPASPGVRTLTDEGSRLAAEGKWAQAAQTLARATAMPDSEPRAWSNLVAALLVLGRRSEAAARVAEARARHPRDSDLAIRAAAILLEAGRAEEAVSVLSEAASANPGDESLARHLATTLPYSPGADGKAILRAHERLASLMPASGPGARPVVRRDGPLRVGFLSSDLRMHSVAFFLEPLLEHLDRSRFETACYSTVAGEDAVTARLRRLSKHWRNVAGASREAGAAAIVADGVDVLVDLCGQLPGARPDIVAMRPAPVQVNWLGYPATAGNPGIDVRIVDAVTDPPGFESQCIERLERIEKCFVCYRPPEGAPAVQPREPGAPVTFGSFNKVAKVNDRTVALWAGVIAASPGSRILIKSLGLEDAEARAQLLARFDRAGVSPDRVSLPAPTAGLAEHLLHYRQVDIALDTWPYHGTTTTCEAMFMGVPVVTLVGGHHAARVGASLLGAVGLGGLAADTPDRFMTIAAGLAADAPRLQGLRAGLRGRMLASALCDAKGFAERFGGLLTRLCRG